MMKDKYLWSIKEFLSKQQDFDDAKFYEAVEKLLIEV